MQDDPTFGSSSGATTTDLWTFRSEPGIGDVDLTGFKVEALDGDIGKVDECTYEVGGSYLIVDTGPWIFGKKVMLPAGVVNRIDSAEERVFVDRTKEEITNAPEFEPGTGLTDADYRTRLGDYYRR